MRYELTGHEWAAIRPMLPNKPRGGAKGERPARTQWHLVGLAIWSTWHSSWHDPTIAQSHAPIWRFCHLPLECP